MTSCTKAGNALWWLILVIPWLLMCSFVNTKGIFYDNIFATSSRSKSVCPSQISASITLEKRKKERKSNLVSCIWNSQLFVPVQDGTTQKQYFIYLFSEENCSETKRRAFCSVKLLSKDCSHLMRQQDAFGEVGCVPLCSKAMQLNRSWHKSRQCDRKIVWWTCVKTQWKSCND